MQKNQFFQIYIKTLGLELPMLLLSSLRIIHPVRHDIVSKKYILVLWKKHPRHSTERPPLLLHQYHQPLSLISVYLTRSCGGRSCPCSGSPWQTSGWQEWWDTNQSRRLHHHCWIQRRLKHETKPDYHKISCISSNDTGERLSNRYFPLSSFTVILLCWWKD